MEIFINDSFLCFVYVRCVFWLMEKLVKKKLLVIAVLVLLSCFLVLVSLKFFVPQKYLQVNSDYYTNQLALEWTTSKISDEYLPKNFQRPENANQVAGFAKLNSKKLTVQLVNDKTQAITLKSKRLGKRKHYTYFGLFSVVARICRRQKYFHQRRSRENSSKYPSRPASAQINFSAN